MKKALVLCALIAALMAEAEVKLPAVFSDHAVLQRNRPVLIWGRAKPEGKVTIQFAEKKYETTAKTDGQWSTTLPAMEASAEPRTLIVSDADGSVAVKDILVGEVWLLGGQSNMEWLLNNAENGPETAAKADNPLLRLITIGHQTSYLPSKDARGAWTTCTPMSAGKFSAIGYFFGRELVQELGIPVGLINDNWGGSAIEPWISPEGFRSEPALAAAADAVEAKIPGTKINRELTAKTLTEYKEWIKRFETETQSGKPAPMPPPFPDALKIIPNDPKAPTVIFNGKIAPIAPYALRGALWYQGESNNPDGMRYTPKLRALYNSWKRAFLNDELEFYVVQLAPFNFGNNYNLPGIWLAQTEFVKNEPRAAMAVINDIGDFGNIHPPKKEPVGHRLALLALKRCYGKNVAAYSPALKSLTRDGGLILLDFDHAESLRLTNNTSKNFEIAGKDGVFHPAAVALSGTRLLLSSEKVSEPYLARYGWKNCFVGDVFNQNGLPLGTFRAGELPEEGIYDKVVPGIGKYKMVYKYNLKSGAAKRGYVDYIINRAGEFSAPIKRIAYFMQLELPDGQWQYVWAAVDPFTQDYTKIGVPTAASKAIFHWYVNNLEVLSNVSGVKNGKFERGNIEFWSNAFTTANIRDIPGANPKRYDFGNCRLDTGDYGSMQLHNFMEKQTVFAYNNFNAAEDADLGIGNNPDAKGHPNWTFSKSAKNYKQALLYVFVETETP